MRVGVVEDDPRQAKALLASLGAEKDFEVCGLATTVAAGRKLVRSALDVLLLDLALPDGDGLEVLAARGRQSAPKVVVLTLFGEVEPVVRAIEGGADGYLLKGADGPEVAAAIRTVHQGGAPLSPAVARHVLRRLRGDRHDAPPRKATRPGLSGRELSVLELLAKGLSYKEVAATERISYHTVADAVKGIYRKLAVNSRGEAVYEAVHSGVLKLGR